jgi:hypothetical protein
MKPSVDLHIHTTASDGTLTPTQVVELARNTNLAAIAITDHDTMSGVPQAQAAGEALGVEVLAGIEISTDHQGCDTHVLGYGLDPTAPALQTVLDFVSADRRARNVRIAQRMRRDGVAVSLEELEQRFPGGTVGRPHFARLLVEQGRAASVSDAFARYLDPGKPYYQERAHLPIAQAVEIIRQCGGVAVLAHPLQYGYAPAQLEQLVADARKLGMVGLECHYTGYTEEQQRSLAALAAQYGLIVTGGSDFHGDNKPDIALGRGHGSLFVPYDCLTQLRQQIGGIN